MDLIVYCKREKSNILNLSKLENLYIQKTTFIKCELTKQPEIY